jgi:hypothetical protein
LCVCHFVMCVHFCLSFNVCVHVISVSAHPCIFSVCMCTPPPMCQMYLCAFLCPCVCYVSVCRRAYMCLSLYMSVYVSTCICVCMCVLAYVCFVCAICVPSLCKPVCANIHILSVRVNPWICVCLCVLFCYEKIKFCNAHTNRMAPYRKGSEDVIGLTVSTSTCLQ